MSGVDYAGQWRGSSNGDPNGEALLDLENREGKFFGTAMLFSENTGGIHSIIALELGNAKDQTLNSQVFPFISDKGIIPKDELHRLSPDASFPDNAEIKISSISETKTTVSWKTDIGTYGEMDLTRAAPPNRSKTKANPDVSNWASFRKYVSNLNFRDYIFRGQSRPYPLQTSFHRTSRKVLSRYVSEDVQLLHRSLTGRTRHLFDIDKPKEMGAFLNLAQHHGFPTPLLDWTYSPFVAAWFGFQNISQDQDNNEKIRIFAIDRKVLLSFNQFQNISFVPPHISILEALAIENDRAVPQQGLLTLTNLHDIESHIHTLEKASQKKILSAFDLPRSDAVAALNDLAMMGITRASLFPGIEGICLDHKDRYFG